MTDDSRLAWGRVIRGEYREMPGLALTLLEAQRLWGLDRDTCHSLLDELTREHFLRRTSRAQYVRLE